MYGACTVLCTVHVRCMYGENNLIVRCMCGACTVHYDKNYSKEEQQTRQTYLNQMEVVSSNRKAVWVNTMVLKATLF